MNPRCHVLVQCPGELLLLGRGTGSAESRAQNDQGGHWCHRKADRRQERRWAKETAEPRCQRGNPNNNKHGLDEYQKFPGSPRTFGQPFYNLRVSRISHLAPIDMQPLKRRVVAALAIGGVLGLLGVKSCVPNKQLLAIGSEFEVIGAVYAYEVALNLNKRRPEVIAIVPLMLSGPEILSKRLIRRGSRIRIVAKDEGAWLSFLLP